MNIDKLYTRAVAALPKAVRTRLDGAAPLDWAVLEDPDTGARLGDAARSHGRLPERVETLANRLLGDVGVIPAHLAAGAEGNGVAGAWSQTVTIEAEGESYRILNSARGALHSEVRPEAVAGYVMLALELATAVHEAGERWAEAGERHRAASDGASSLLALCAVHFGEQLRAGLDAAPARRTTAALASVLDHAWNSQPQKTRAALSGVRLRVGRGACAPRRSYFAPSGGYRLHSFEPGEIRWLHALAEQAATAPAEEKPADERPSNGAMRATAPERSKGVVDAGATDISSLEARIRAANEGTETLHIGSTPNALDVDHELAELMGAATGLSDAVRRRMRESYGVGFTQALSRLRSAEDADAVASEIKAALSKHRVPRWLHELAATLLMDAGAHTRSGRRTTGVGIEAEAEPETGYRAIEVQTGATGQITPLGLVEQARFCLAFAQDAWRGHNGLRSAGKESGWILDKGETEGSEFAEDERDTLEAARRIEHALDRIQRADGKDAQTALVEASTIADALKRVGATARVAAGWPSTADAPDPRNPEEVARIAAVAEALNERIRSIANRYIASWIAGPQDEPQAREDGGHLQSEKRDSSKDDDSKERHQAGLA